MTRPGSGDGEAVDADALAHTATAAGARRDARSDAQLGRGDALGRYTVVEVLGAGGMGVVYGAYDPDLDRKVALKVLRTAGGDEPGASEADRARLLREARAMARLSHPNVITVFEVGTVGGIDFVAMEFVDGVTLAEWLRERRRSWREILDVFVEVGRGLAAAHDAGLVHRDLKPANVLIRRDGRVLVTDFGLARMEGEGTDAGASPADDRPLDVAATASPGLTQTGALVGTPAYMAPEQHEGRAADARSDQFSFCVALWEALHGERPFAGETLAELRRSVTAGTLPAPADSGVPPRVHEVLERGLGVEPEHRFRSMDALLAELERASAGRRPGRLRVGGAVAAAALVGIGTLALMFGDGDAEADPICGPAARSFAGVWDADLRDRLRSALVEGTGPLGRQAFTRLSAELDRYRDAWQGTHSGLCADRDARGFHPAMACMLDRRAEVDALVEVLLDADTDLVENAVAALDGVIEPAECATERARSAPPPPGDPAERRAVQELRANLARARALQRAHRFERAREIADATTERARELDYAPALVEALYRAGAVRIARREDVGEARRLLEEAAIRAEEAGHDEYRARALVALTEHGVAFSSDRAATREVARKARAAARRYGDPSLEARLDVHLAAMALEEDDHDEARRLLERARTIQERTGETLEMVDVLEQLGALGMQGGEWEEAVELFGRAARLAREILGEDHPRSVTSRETYARMLALVGRYDDAAAEREAVGDYWSTERGRNVLADDADDAGRVLRGRVVGPGGEPVAGAAVAGGDRLTGDGRTGAAYVGGRFERAHDVSRARSDTGGRFELSELTAGGDVLVIAEHGDVGRSMPIVAGPSDEDVVVELRPYGSLRGSVRGDARLIELVPSAVERQLNYSVVVAVDEDGAFEIPRVPAGDYRLVAIDSALPTTMQRASTRRVEVAAGRTTEVAVDDEDAGLTVDVVVRGADPARSTVQALLVRGRFHADTVGDFNRSFLGASPSFMAGFLSAAQEGPSERGRSSGHIRFEGVAPGLVSLCIAELGGDFKDPEFLRGLAGDIGSLPIHCSEHELSPEPAEQELVIDLPR